MKQADPLLAQIERFLEASGMDPTVFGEKAMNDGNFVRDLRKGRETRRKTRERVERFIKEAQAELRIERSSRSADVAAL